MRVLLVLLVALVLGTIGLVVHHESSRGPRIKVAAVDENESMVTISKGERVDIESHVASQGMTIVEFYGVFCPVCRMVGPQLEALARNNPRIKLRVVDIGAWDSAVAQQYSIRALPTLWLYEDGELYSKDRKTIYQKLSLR